MDGFQQSMNDATTDAASLFAPLWKRKWLILAVAFAVGAGSYVYYKHQPAVYTASARLFIGTGAEQSLLGGPQVKTTLSGRALADQVEIINSSVVGEVVHKLLREEKQFAAAKGKVKASASGTSDFITIATEARTPKAAVRLANAYAEAYTRRQRANYLRGVKAAIANAKAQLRRVEPGPSGKGKGARPSSSTATIQAANLYSKINQLESALSGFSGVQQVSPAKASPLPVSPTPKKNAIFGFVLGLVLAAVGAYALSRLDRRTRTLADVEALYRTQILAALPSVKSPTVRPRGERGPAKSLVEPLRRLHTTLKLGDMLDGSNQGGPRVIVFLSPDAGDGRSTLIANLARVQADAGERVAVIEADFRRPTQGRLLDVAGPNGLAEVLAGKVDFGVAMQAARTGGLASAAEGELDTVVQSESLGAVSVLLSGGAVGNPPAFLASEAMADLLRSISDEFEYVLIDVPPPLEVSDAMPLLHLVDGIILVARIGHTRIVSAERLLTLLEHSSSAPVLGAVANCVPRKDVERYGFSWAPTEQRRRKLSRR
jgi:succinoglycan biosynthesis transport protein ExoP